MDTSAENAHDTERLVDLFTRVSDSILSAETDPARKAHRLRQLPEVLVFGAADAATDEERQRLDPLVHRLRADAAKLIRERVAEASDRERLRELCERGRSELEFREWRDDDLAVYREMLDDPTVWDYLPEDYPDPLTDDLAKNLIEISRNVPDRHIVRAVEWRGRPVGQVRLQFDSSPYDDSAEISYWTGKPFWGKGLTGATVARFTQECFERVPQLEHIFAEVLEGNAASIRLLEKAGYHRESFKFRNIVKRGGKVFSTHVLGVHRVDYVD